jgi:hypothetical protein
MKNIVVRPKINVPFLILVPILYSVFLSAQIKYNPEILRAGYLVAKQYFKYTLLRTGSLIKLLSDRRRTLLCHYADVFP